MTSYSKRPKKRKIGQKCYSYKTATVKEVLPNKPTKYPNYTTTETKLKHQQIQKHKPQKKHYLRKNKSKQTTYTKTHHQEATYQTKQKQKTINKHKQTNNSNKMVLP